MLSIDINTYVLIGFLNCVSFLFPLSLTNLFGRGFTTKSALQITRLLPITSSCI